MSSDKPVIRARQIGKKYRIGGPQERYFTLRDTIVNVVKSPLKAFHDLKDVEEFWALKDISFNVEQGEVIGIIGRNGAGKSTLLKILSRITTPTEGIAELYGRVGSLLEIGTGFHPEMTGRENIYLNGSILGMRRKEIDSKLDEIVRFSEIEKFLDTPVKRYSSGMYVRLAFAVAAHLEPDILVIDEVLAVGDAAFQKKCLGKMEEVAEHGRTVLFVSHNLVSIENLCTRGIILNNGRIVYDGELSGAIEQYTNSLRLFHDNADLFYRKDRKGSREILIRQLCFYNENMVREGVLFSGRTYYAGIHFQVSKQVKASQIHFGISVYSQGAHLFTLSTEFTGKEVTNLVKDGIIYCKIRDFPLSSGTYTYNLICRIGNSISDWIQNAGIISVEGGDYYGSGHIPGIGHPGIMLRHEWLLENEIFVSMSAERKINE